MKQGNLQKTLHDDETQYKLNSGARLRDIKQEGALQETLAKTYRPIEKKLLTSTYAKSAASKFNEQAKALADRGITSVPGYEKPPQEYYQNLSKLTDPKERPKTTVKDPKLDAKLTEIKSRTYKSKLTEPTTLHRIRARTVKKIEESKTWHPAGRNSKKPEFTDEELR